MHLAVMAFSRPENGMKIDAVWPQRIDAGWSSPVARQAHNLKVVGSNPTPATNKNPLAFGQGVFCLSVA